MCLLNDNVYLLAKPYLLHRNRYPYYTYFYSVEDAYCSGEAEAEVEGSVEVAGPEYAERFVASPHYVYLFGDACGKRMEPWRFWNG